MNIPLIANWKEKFKAGNAKVYPLGPKDREIVNTEFYQLHAKDAWTGADLCHSHTYALWYKQLRQTAYAKNAQ